VNVGSLFTGIGGFDLGLERAGMRVVWQCEQDEFCRRVLARHWPGVPCYPDVRALVADASGVSGPLQRVGVDQRAQVSAGAGDVRSPVPVQVPPVDVLCGGFPCQDISLAGKGAGIGGARSGLWSEYARLVGELRPRYVIVENVAALLARGLGRVVGDLAALGYDAEWDCLPASAFGAPHRRDRLWLVAYPNGEGEPGRSVDEKLGRGLMVSGGTMADTEGVGRPRAGAEMEATHARPGQLGRAHGEAQELADADSEARTGSGSATQAVSEPGTVERPGRRGSPSGDVQDADERALLPWRVGGRAAQAGGPEWWAVEPPVGRVAHGVPDRLDQLAALGNALVPQIAEWLGRRILDYEEGRIAA
jgi:DNA (cytosine-5)-methyltransferase 1